MAGHEYEINSFICKFRELWGAGIESHLNMDSQAGNAWMNLSVNLGPFQGLPLSKKHQSPSRIRRREKRAAGFTFSEHSEKSSEEPSVNNSSAIGVVENEDRSTLIDDKESKVNFNQECGLFVKNTEEILIKDESLAVEASDSNLVIHPVNETLEYQNIDGNSTAVTLKEDVKIVDDLGSEEHDIVSTDVEGFSIVNVHATAVIES